MKFTTRFTPLIALAVCTALISATLPTIGLQAQTAAPIAPGTPAPTTQSTVTSDPSCTLSVGDCSLLAQATANVALQKTFTQTVDFALVLNDKNPLNITAKGSGPFAFDPTAAPLGFRTALDLVTTDSRKTTAGALSLVVTNGDLYYKTGTNWQAVQLTGKSDVPVGTPSATLAATLTPTRVPPTLAATSPSAIPTLNTLTADLATLTAQPGVVTLTRNSANATLDNQAMAQFVYTFDLQKLVESPGSAPAITDLLKAVLAAGGKAAVAARLNERTVQAVLALVGRGLGKSTLTVTRWVGLTDQQFHAIDVEIGIDFRLNPLPTAKSTTGTLHLLVTLGAIGTPVTITVPTATSVSNASQLGSSLLNGSGLLSGPLGALLGR